MRLFTKKKLGQHFLHDQNIIAKIVKLINPKPDDNIIEIGPGLGALTLEILPLAKQMLAIELDTDIILELQNKCAKLGDLEIYNQDFLKTDLQQFLAPLRLIGNLPYNISTPILFKAINNIASIQDMHFMLQKEVAQRVVAKPGSKIYGRLSIMVQYYCSVELLLQVGPGSFTPPPKVDSAVIRLTPKPQPLVQALNNKLFSDVVRAAFCQRRKTIHNSLKEYITTEGLQSISIDPKTRPEQLSVDSFVLISNWCGNNNLLYSNP